MSFTQNYNKLKDQYYTISKKILNYETRRDLSDEERIKQYTIEIVAAYNNFVTFVSENLPKQKSSIQNKVNSKFERFYERNFLRCLHTLKLNTVLPGKYVEINLDSLVAYEQGASTLDLSLQIDIDNTDSPLNSDDENEKNIESDPKLNVENLQSISSLILHVLDALSSVIIEILSITTATYTLGKKSLVVQRQNEPHRAEQTS